MLIKIYLYYLYLRKPLKESILQYKLFQLEIAMPVKVDNIHKLIYYIKLYNYTSNEIKYVLQDT